MFSYILSFFRSLFKKIKIPGVFPGRSGRVLLLVLFVVGLALVSHTAYNAGSGSSEMFVEVDEAAAEKEMIRFSEEELDYFDEEITGLLLRNGFNGSVLIARYGTILYQRTFGFADFRNNTPINPTTSFQLASISKTFTASAVLMLQEDSLLDIDDPVQRHIPTFPYEQITIRQLLNHTSGLQNYMYQVEHHWKKPALPSNEDVLDLFLRHPRPLDFTPGARFAYSNTGYAFLGLLIERVSGKRYPDFIRDRIFTPLGMDNSYVYDLHGGTIYKNRAYGFRPGRRSPIIIPDVDHDGVFGDKGIYSNAIDLYKWDQAIYNNALLPAHVWQEAFEPARLRNNNVVNYGHGWRLQTFMDRRIVHHPGRWNGFRNSMKRYVDDHATLILLNNTNRDISWLVNEIQKTIFHEEFLMLADADDQLDDEEGWTE